MLNVRWKTIRDATRWVKAALPLLLLVFCHAPRIAAQSSAQNPSTPPVPADAKPVDSSNPAAPTATDTQQTTPQQSGSKPPPASTSPSDAQQPSLPDAPAAATPKTAGQTKNAECAILPCQVPLINWYMRFENGPQVKPLTPKEKAWLATKNLIDPFNIITILGEAGIAVGSNSHSPYGPGWMGYERYVGVSFTQDLTGEFFNTFLIPSIVHQDPHYHRMPHASYSRRIFHAIDQVVWTQGDNGKGMLNYAVLVGYGIDNEITNLYVPGIQTNGRATAERYGIGVATAPIDNFITEFLPDVAKRIHVQVVIVQRIINQVASKDSGT
jgi:hypothetical protein